MSSAPWRDALRDTHRERHLALLYREEGFLHGCVATWAAESLTRGGGAILVGRGDAIAEIRSRLMGLGLDVNAHEATGRLALFDAEDIMRRFMREATPSPAAFRAIIGEILSDVRRATGPTGPLRVWGEMVDLLWERENGEAATQLESLWNYALAESNTSLLCSYKLQAAPSKDMTKLIRGSSSHGHVLVEARDAEFASEVTHALREVFGELTPTVPQHIYAHAHVVKIGTEDPSAILVSRRDVRVAR